MVSELSKSVSETRTILGSKEVLLAQMQKVAGEFNFA